MTAVQWLDEQIQERTIAQDVVVRKIIIEFSMEGYMRLKQEALQMEKQQMCDFFRQGYMWCNSPSLHMENGKVITSTVKYGELYYEIKYGSKGSDVPQLKYKDGTPIRSYDSPKIQEMVKLMNEDTYKVWECCGMEECICKGSDETKTK